VLLLAACGGSGGTTTPSPTATAAQSSGESSAPSEAATPTEAGTGQPSLDAPDEVAAGATFEIAWTGPRAQGDYITMVAAGATEWTNEQYFDTAGATSPGTMTAPVGDGAYELWYVGGDGTILARRDIQVLPFEGALLGPVEVEAGSQFEVAWNGPNGSGDYVTIVAVGADRWTNESYFYTRDGSPGTLVAPISPGAYVLWYVPGSETAPTATSPITVRPYVVTLDAPDEVDAGAQFEVEWTGPDGPSDYITIVPAGSAEGTYLSYAYTRDGSPATITAPDEPGDYEIWYASDRVGGTFASIDIVVR
jgi:Ca-activated chloride channel family protein